MRARSAAAGTVDPCTGSAAITVGAAHSTAVPPATAAHRRQALGRHALKLSTLTNLRAPPLLPRVYGTSSAGLGAPELVIRNVRITNGVGSAGAGQVSRGSARNAATLIAGAPYPRRPVLSRPPRNP